MCSFHYCHKFIHLLVDVVMSAFKKYLKSSHDCLRPDAQKIKAIIGQRFKNWAYTVSTNEKKKHICAAAMDELTGSGVYIITHRACPCVIV